MGLALGMVLKIDASLAKWLNLETRKFWGSIPTFVEVTLEKLVAGIFFHPRPNLTCVIETSAWQKWYCLFEFISVAVGILQKSSKVPVLEVDS